MSRGREDVAREYSHPDRDADGPELELSSVEDTPVDRTRLGRSDAVRRYESSGRIVFFSVPQYSTISADIRPRWLWRAHEEMTGAASP